jgi:hypothetical protein
MEFANRHAVLTERVAKHGEEDGLSEDAEFLESEAALLAQGIRLVQNCRYRC